MEIVIMINYIYLYALLIDFLGFFVIFVQNAKKKIL